MPGDMVVNAMMAAQHEAVYHVSSSLRNPAPYAVLYRTGLRYFTENPRVGKNGQVVRARKVHFLGTIASFRIYMVVRYRLPLEMLRLLNLLCCGLFSHLYGDLARKYKFVMHLVDLYGPFSLFEGCFDDVNLEKLRLAMAAKHPDDCICMFNFDPKTVDWDDYFYKINIPGVMMCVYIYI